MVVQTSPLVAPEASGLKEGGKSEVGTVSAPVKPMSKGNVLGRGIHPKVVVLCVSRLCFGAIIEDLFRDIPAFRPQEPTWHGFFDRKHQSRRIGALYPGNPYPPLQNKTLRRSSGAPALRVQILNHRQPGLSLNRYSEEYIDQHWRPQIESDLPQPSTSPGVPYLRISR